MPELPEVETVKETLKPLIIGKTINEVSVKWDNIIKTDLLEFKEKIKNQKFVDIKRRGKFLIFELSDYDLISHLRMEGKYYLLDKPSEFTKHDHIIFRLNDKYLTYNDTRKFGTMHLFEKGKYKDIKPVNKLGYEPFDDDIDYEVIKNKFKTNKPIKQTLLDQSIICGLGNIYVDEVIFLLKVHPSTKTIDLIERIADVINYSIQVLNKAIKLGGTTIKSYTSSLGVTGRFQNELQVHQQVGKECRVCKTIIKKTKVAGRGTYYCEQCQK